MNLNRKRLAVALSVALGGSMGALVMSSPAFADAAKVEKVEITGSNIKRVDQETVAPVEVISREQIERSGSPTIAEVLRNVPANTGGSYSESTSNSFAPGASGIALRGMGQKTTLVLINGRRTSNYGFAQNLQDTFVDLNSIPSSAVERIEILKDGASAIYGSDAIAGVVNVIMRQDYKGMEVTADGGKFDGKHDYRFTATAGKGDIGADGYNAFGVVEYYKRDFLAMSDTSFGSSRDYRWMAGGRNMQSLTGGGTWRQYNAAGTTATYNYRAISSCRGTVMTGPQAVAAGLIGAPAANTVLNIPGNTFCTQDFASEFTALPQTERWGFIGRGTRNFSATTQGYADVGLSRVETFQTFQDPFFAATTGLSQTAAGLRPFTYNINFAPGVAGNPFPTTARYNGVLGDMGTRDTKITSDTARIVVGAKYVIGSWDADSAVGVAKNSVKSEYFNRLSIAGVGSLFGVTSAAQPPVPMSTASAYNLDNFTLNSAATRDMMRANFDRKSDSNLTFFDTKVSSEMGSLPGGPIGVAAGFEYRNEKLKDSPAAIAQSGGILGQGITATDGSRTSYAMFAEVGLPINNMLEGQVAARYDHYSDFGTAVTPKLGLKFKPSSSWLFRANWGKGFRAPTLPEISPSVATFFTTVVDPTTGAGTSISGVYAGNPNLQAEHSKSTTVGVVFEPSADFNMGLNYYDILWKNVVSAPSFQSVVNAGGSNVIRDPSTGAIVTVLNNYTNLSNVVTRGVDFDAKYSIPTAGYGKFTFRLNVAYVANYQENGYECAGRNDCSNTIPRVKGNLALDWDMGPWSATAKLNHIHAFYQGLISSSYFTVQDPQFQNGTYPTKEPAYNTVDLFGRYKITPNLQVSASLINVFNKKPYFDPAWSYLYDVSQYDGRDRQLHVGAKYVFK